MAIDIHISLTIRRLYWFSLLVLEILGCHTVEPVPTSYKPPSLASSKASLVSIQSTGSQTAELIIKTSPSLKSTEWQLIAQTATGQPISLEASSVYLLTTFSLNAVRVSGLAIGQTYRFQFRYLYNGRDTIRVERLYQHRSPANWRRLAHLDADGGDFTAMLMALSDADPFGTATSLLTYRYVDEQTSDRLIYQTDQDSWLSIQQPYAISHQQVLFRLREVVGVAYVFAGLGYQDNEVPLLIRIYPKTFSGIKPDYAGEDGEIAIFTTKSQAFFLTQQGSPALWIRNADWSQRRGHDFPETPGTLGTFVINGIGYVVNQREGQFTHLFAYDPTTDQWTRKADFPGSSRSRGIGFSVAGKGYFGAGITGEQEKGLRDIWQYDSATNGWQYITDYPGQGNQYLVSYSTTAKAYIGWGYENQPSPSGGTRLVGCTDFWEFTP